MIEKIWGTTQSLIRSPMFELHRLIIKPMHRCSLHVHQFKSNAFYVIKGKLHIDSVVGDFGDTLQTTTLLTGDSAVIGPGVHHQFRTGPEVVEMFEPVACVALEAYFTEPLSEDIIRRNIGGRVDG